MNINYLDIGLALFLLGFGAIGFIVGFTEKIFSILSWSGSAFTTYHTYNFVTPWIQKWIDKPSIVTVVSCVGLFLIYLALFSLLSKGIHERIEKSMFKKADRYLGILLGLASGYLVMILAALICRAVVPNNQYPTWSKDSIIWHSAEQGGNLLERFLPLGKPTTTFFHTEPTKTAPIKKPKPKPKKILPTKKTTYSAKDQKALDTLVKEYT